MERSAETCRLVRCLDCGTEYELTSEQVEPGPCPDCGGVGWIALAALSAASATREDDS